MNAALSALLPNSVTYVLNLFQPLGSSQNIVGRAKIYLSRGTPERLTQSVRPTDQGQDARNRSERDASVAFAVFGSKVSALFC